MTLPADPRRVYVTDDPHEDDRRARKHALVREVKQLVEHVALLDLSGIEAATLDDAARDVAALSDRLAGLPSLRARGGLASAGTPDAALMERSGISGRSNPLAPPLHLRMCDDGVTVGHAVYTAAYEGPAGCAHGGFVAAAFDDLLGFAQLASGRAGYTGTLTVKMILPTPLNERIDYRAWFDHLDGRKIFCRATASHGERLLAEAEIVFIIPRDGSLPR